MEPARRDKPWTELRQIVRESRKEFTSLVCRLPSHFRFHTFKTEQGTVNRLYFLGIGGLSRENTLFYVDIPAEYDPDDGTLPWKRLLESSNQSYSTEQLSKAEQLLRERKRLDTCGITAYEYHDIGETFVFSALNCLFVCQDKDAESKERAIPVKVPTDCPGATLDPKFCPSNTDWVTFIHNNDIWVADVKGQNERRLTFAQKGLECKSAGVPSFIVQEEFQRFTGYWWQPDSAEKGANTERILYEEVNESCVMSVNVFSSGTDSQHLDEFRYPRAGTCNAICTLKIVEIDKDSYGRIGTEIRERQLSQSLTDYFPWCEYIVRAGWTKNGQVWAVLFDRRQGQMVLILIPLECFVPVTTIPPDTSTNEKPPPKIHVIYDETSLIWVKVHNLIHFFRQESPDEISYIWASEKSGYRHLYHVTSSLRGRGEVTTATDSGHVTWESLEDDEHKALIVKEQALTSGSWEVTPQQLWVDETKGLVYFMGLKDSVLESHLYVTSYLHPRKPQRLTQPGFCHSVQLDQSCSKFVTVYSSIDQPHLCDIFSICHCDDGSVIVQTMANLLAPCADITEFHSPELFSFVSKAGHQNHGMVFKPHAYTPGVQYPTVLFVYGGPEVQLVTNSFKALKFLRLHTLAAEGYVVVALDGRGSSCRGLQYEGWTKNRLGTVEIEDQVEGLHWLASNVDYIDLQRVAIHGWSYGGYLSLLGLAQRPDVFKLAISGAPVTQWTLYDTGYTERYMDLPDSNPEGYKLGSVLNYVTLFPNEENRLLIIHGLMDENVQLQHTTSLIDALVRHCKPYQLQLYPGERHGIRGVEANDHYKTTVLSFLQKNL